VFFLYMAAVDLGCGRGLSEWGNPSAEMRMNLGFDEERLRGKNKQ
jgi:hypothetical protein